MASVPAAPGSLPKPVLRGLHNATIKRNLGVSLVLVAIISTAYKFMVNDAKKNDYAEFYKNYDAQKSFERMKSKGLFQSCS